MPGYIIHLAIGKECLKNNKNIKDESKFLEGIIRPDMLQKPQSHYGSDTAHPDLNYYIDTHDMTDDFNKGYFLHLVTDYLFYNKYLEKCEWSPSIYDDYDRLNKELIEKYQVEIPEELKPVVQFKNDELEVLNLDNISTFIETLGKINIEELLQNRKYDSIYNKTKKDVYEK